MFDLDTGTTFLGNSIGWDCPGGPYLDWVTGDNTSQDGYEQVNVLVDQALADGQWTSSVQVGLVAGWYQPANGSGSAQVRVTYNGVTKSKTINPGSDNKCETTSVGTVTVYDDSTFDLA